MGGGEDQVFSVYVTAADADEARRIGRVLVEEDLAACVNILPGHTAIYRWEGKLEEGAEAAFLAKTTAGRFDTLRARIRALHSYALPCIVAFPAEAGDAEFLDWVRAAVGTGRPSVGNRPA
jgi:periplasmic divalent cation tolerance protein